MTLLSAWALAGLVLALPLLALHLWRRRPPRREVASLLSWRELALRPGGGNSRFARPLLPILLVLQLLALALLVFALAKPQASAEEGPRRVFVVDESVWMTAGEGGGTRIDAAREELRARLGRLPGGEPVAIVGAGPAPAVLFRGSAGDAGGSLGELEASDGAGDLAGGLRLAAGQRGDGGRVLLLRAPEDPAPTVRGAKDGLGTAVVGSPAAGVLLEGADSRCLPDGGACEAFVRVRNTGGEGETTEVRMSIGATGRSRSVTVPAHSTSGVLFEVPAAATAVRFELTGGRRALAAAAGAHAVLQGGEEERVTLVGEREQALPLARALAAVPGVKLRLRAPDAYRPSDARDSDLLVLDGFLPRGALPAAPALLLVDPPRLPGGAVGGKLADSRLSGEQPASPLLAGVELDALTIGAGGARRITPPDWLGAVAWSAEGPLIAAGEDGGRRIAVVGFQPAESNLPQLSSFPLLASNLVAWSREWAPAAVAAGEVVAVQAPPGTTATTVAGSGPGRQLRAEDGTATLRLSRPGLYTVVQEGPWGARERQIAVNAEPAPPPAGEAVDLAAAATAGPGAGTDLWPWALAAALLVLAAAIGYELWSGGGVRARPLVLALEAAGFVLVALALVVPAFHHDPPPTTLVLDHSRSVAGGDAGEAAWRDAIAECDDCRAIGFGGRESDLEAGLAQGLAETPRGGRVVLLSDGRQTSGEAAALAPRARAAGVVVDSVPISSPRFDAAVSRVRAPAALHAGDPLSLQFTVVAGAAARARISLLLDGSRLGGEAVRLRAGENPYLFSLRAPARPGPHSYRVEIAAAGDEVTADDAMATTLTVAPQPSVLVAGAAGSPIAATLAADGIDVSTVEPAALPETAAGYAGTDAVVLEDVPAKALGDARAAALAEAVRTEALGLFAVGGGHSFSLGHYYDSPLQAALPVRSLEPGKLQRRNLAVELVLDRSGSMIDEVGGVPKIEMAQAAARGAVGFLARHHDEVGIVAFDIKPRILVPVGRITSPTMAKAIEAKIDGLVPEGGTNIYRGLAEGVAQIEGSKGPHRHIILMSDGISEHGSYRRLLPKLRAEHITVASVALGDEADVKLLKEIAADTGGNFYETENARELPGIFAKETRLNARPVLLHGQIGVTAGAPSPVVSSLVGESLPPLRGNVVTTPQAGAEAGLLGQDRGHPPDPVLAQWQYGLGRAAAWTPGLAPQFAGEWAERPRLFQDAARWAERGVSPSPLTPAVAPGEPPRLEIDTAANGASSLEAEAVDGTLRPPAGEAEAIAFERVAPGRYLAGVPRLKQGVYGYAVAGGGLSASGLLAVPYPAELRPLRSEATPLGPLAAGSGGTVLAAGDPGALGSFGPSSWWWLALAGLLAFLAGASLALLRPMWLSFPALYGGKDNHGPLSGGKDNHDAGGHNGGLLESRPTHPQRDRA